MSFFGLFGPPNVARLKAKGDINGLIKALKYEKDVQVRVAAAKALGQIKNMQAVEPLKVAVKDLDNNVQQAAATALVQIGINALDDHKTRTVAIQLLAEVGVVAVQPLIEILNNSRVRDSAIEALIKIGTPSVASLLLVLKNKDGNIIRIVKALGQIGDTRAVEPLITLIKDENNDWVRQAVVGALEQIGDVQAITPLIPLLKSDNKDLSKAVAHALNSLKWQPSNNEQRAWLALADGKWDDLASLGAVAIKPLRKVINNNKDRNTQQAALGALRQITDPQAVEQLIELLSSNKNSQIRQAAAEALGQIKNAQGIELLLEILSNENEDWQVRRAAIYALGRVGDTRAREILIATLNDKDHNMHEAAAQMLGEMGGTQAVDPLKKLLKDERCSRAAVMALARIDSPQAVDALIIALKDKNSAASAARALGHIRDRQAVGPLIEALNKYKNYSDHKDYSALTAIAGALGDFRDAQVVEPLARLYMTNIGIAERDALGSLQQVLEHSAQSIKESDLRLVAKLSDSIQVDYSVDCPAGKFKERKDNCVQVVQLARQELIRRGIRA